MSDKPNKISLSAFIEQTAQFLRHELKKEPILAEGRVSKMKSTGVSSSNTIVQIAKLLRTQVHKSTKKKKKN